MFFIKITKSFNYYILIMIDRFYGIGFKMTVDYTGCVSYLNHKERIILYYPFGST